MMYRVYGLVEKGSTEIKYIGCSKQKYLSKRKAQHIESAKKSRYNDAKEHWIKYVNYKIDIVVIRDGIETKREAILAEDYFISKHKETITNKSSAISPPPQMGGHNKIELPVDCINKLGTIPDHKLAEKYKVSKKKITTERNIQSFASRTGNDGKIKKGEPHRRWSKGVHPNAH